MKEHPILFNTEMVQTILDGRKTQTRRIMKRQPDAVERFHRGEVTLDTDAKHAILRCYNNPKGFKKCNSGWFADGNYTPFHEFSVGDRLWVRETHAFVPSTAYRASDVDQIINPNDSETAVIFKAGFKLSQSGFSWKPSIQMTRSASRILLEITKIRVERLQDISDDDVICEGGPVGHRSIDSASRSLGYRNWPQSWFAQTWDFAHKKDERKWDKNPWVWVIEFAVIKGGAA